MVTIQFFYHKDTLQIDAVYRDCKSNSTKYKDTLIYAEVNVTDPLYEVSRDHMVILDVDGNVVGTTYNLNPDQPTPIPDLNKDMADWMDSQWGTGVPEKIDIVKKAVKYLLGYPEP